MSGTSSPRSGASSFKAACRFESLPQITEVKVSASDFGDVRPPRAAL